MNNFKNHERLFVAYCSLFFFIAGLYVPHFVGVVRSIFSLPVKSYIWAVRFGFVAEVMAVVLGFFGRRHFSGKVGMYGSVSLVALDIASLLWAYFTTGKI